jgi:CheY-like chemotaxis protein
MAAALLVGGDRSFAKMMRMALEEEGYAIAEAATGDVALAELRRRAETTAVVLLTTRPYANGRAVLEAAVTDEELRRHVFVLVTSESSPLPMGWDALVKALAVAVVTKPVRLDVLLRTLHDTTACLSTEKASHAKSGAV